jgi:integrase
MTTEITRREPRESKKLTNAICETKVEAPDKIYDKECGGLLISVSPTSPATFYLKYTCKVLKQRRTYRLGIYHPQTFTPLHARVEAMKLKARADHGEDIQQTQRRADAHQARLSGITVGEVIDKRIAWMSTDEQKRDGGVRPRKEDWKNVASHLNRFVRPRLGQLIASEVTKYDIATLQKDIVEGMHGFTKSVSNARHMRRAVSAMFNWAAQADNDFVSTSPCVNLPDLPEEFPATRVLSEDEIRTLWHGLDRPDMLWDGHTCLAIKFALVTMLRSTELLLAHRDELDFNEGCINIPAHRVKKRRVINQPLSDLALEIIDEALQSDDQTHIFAGRFKGSSLARNAMANALRGTWRIKNGKRVVKSVGICELLGLEPFTPHDLRRTAATLCGTRPLEFTDAEIAPCLDHQPTKDANGKPLPAVTGKHYNQAQLKNMKQKRAVLFPWADRLRQIVGIAGTKLRLALRN